MIGSGNNNLSMKPRPPTTPPINFSPRDMIPPVPPQSTPSPSNQIFNQQSAFKMEPEPSSSTSSVANLLDRENHNDSEGGN